MNFGLLGLGMQANSGELAGYMTSEVSPLLTSLSSWPNPFMGPALFQPVIRFVADAYSYKKNDVVFVGGQFQLNAGAVGMGAHIEDCSQNLKLRWGSAMYMLGIDGSSNITATGDSNFKVALACVGRRSDLLRGIPLQRVQRATLDPRLLAASSNYKFGNPLGRRPFNVSINLLCRRGDAGFLGGDVVMWDAPGAAASAHRCTIRASATEIELRTAAAGGLLVNHKTTGAETALTLGNWDFIINILA